MRNKLLTFTILGILMVLGTGCASMSGAEKQKVVYHVNYNDEKTLGAAMRNIQNHINAVCPKGDATPCSDKLDVKVVMHGKGVDLLKIANTNPDMQSKVASLKSQHVGFQVCANTLKGRKINYKNDLYDVSEKDIVPSGVAELAKLQQQGYAYIKP